MTSVTANNKYKQIEVNKTNEVYTIEVSMIITLKR